jgi:hypothetical protein
MSDDGSVVNVIDDGGAVSGLVRRTSRRMVASVSAEGEVAVDGWLGGDIDCGGWVGGDIIGDGCAKGEEIVGGWLGGVTDCNGWVGESMSDDGCVVNVIDDGGAVSGMGNTSLTVACLKNRAGNAWRLFPCVRLRFLSRCLRSSVVFLGTRLPLPEPGKCLVTRTQSIRPDAD